MITGHITHDEAMVKEFIENPDYAEELLKAVVQDGDEYEIRRVQTWYDEAKSRSANMGYWDNIIDYAQTAARNGYNLDTIIARVSQALSVLKSAMPAHA